MVVDGGSGGGGSVGLISAYSIVAGVTPRVTGVTGVTPGVTPVDDARVCAAALLVYAAAVLVSADTADAGVFADTADARVFAVPAPAAAAAAAAVLVSADTVKPCVFAASFATVAAFLAAGTPPNTVPVGMLLLVGMSNVDVDSPRATDTPGWLPQALTS